jgi:hypothetical protein
MGRLFFVARGGAETQRRRHSACPDACLPQRQKRSESGIPTTCTSKEQLSGEAICNEIPFRTASYLAVTGFVIASPDPKALPEIRSGEAIYTRN